MLAQNSQNVDSYKPLLLKCRNRFRAHHAMLCRVYRLLVASVLNMPSKLNYFTEQENILL